MDLNSFAIKVEVGCPFICLSIDLTVPCFRGRRGGGTLEELAYLIWTLPDWVGREAVPEEELSASDQLYSIHALHFRDTFRVLTLLYYRNRCWSKFASQVKLILFNLNERRGANCWCLWRSLRQNTQ